MRFVSKKTSAALSLVLGLPLMLTVASPAAAADSAVNSTAINRIKASGVLKVGVLSQLPWIGENPANTKESWYGPTWMQAKKVASELGVKLVPVPVSHETKVTAVQTGQVDITIAPLDLTAAREKVIDFVTNSVDGQCFVALKSDKKVQDVEDLKKPGVKVAIPLGGSQQQLIPPVYPNMQIKPQVLPPGVNWATAATINHTTDVTIFPSAQVYLLLKAYPNKFTVIPKPAECLAHPLLPIKAGWGIQKGHPQFVKFVQGVIDSSQQQFDKEFQAMAKELGK